MKKYNESWWFSWSRNLWETGEAKWIKRSGQDHFYRQKVVLPALRNKLKYFNTINSILDLGCGDGYTLQELFKFEDISFSNDINISLVDLSATQLKIAEQKLEINYRNLKVIHADLNEKTWIKSLDYLVSPKVILNIFVLQEMVYIHNFFQNISEIMCKDDLMLALIVAPKFASNLSRQNANMEHSDKFTDLEKDWHWASKYPITTNSSTIYLPHFHRTIADYRKIISKFNLFVSEVIYLRVPDDIESKEIFRKTDYKEKITETNSSVLLSIKKK